MTESELYKSLGELTRSKITVNAYNFTMKNAQNAGLKIASFSGFTTEWGKFVIKNRDEDFYSHDRDIVIGPVADAILDEVIPQYKREFGEEYLQDDALKVFASRVSPFGFSYIYQQPAL